MDLRRILHPTDLSPESEVAFVHALALAVRSGSSLTLVHVASSGDAGHEWEHFPSVREQLVRWRMLESGSPPSAIWEELGIAVEKVDVRGTDPRRAILAYLDKHPSDMIVLATHGRDGLPRWLHRSVAEPLARQAHTSTLFVPSGARGFIDPDTGVALLRQILVPVDHQPDPEYGVAGAAGLARTAGEGNVEISLAHIAHEHSYPVVDLPEHPEWKWHRRSRGGGVVDGILAEAADINADVIVMATHGHEGILDALRGSTTERVVRHAPCPVLAVPVA